VDERGSDVSAEDAEIVPTVEAAQRGDPLAFEKLVRRFRGRLATYAYALLRDRGHAEDATQEALLLAYSELGTLRDPARFRPWLYAILENAALSGCRYRRRRPSFPLADDEAVAEGSPWEAAAAREEQGAEPPGLRPEVRAVRSALDRLPGHYAEALLLHYVDGLSARDLAGALGLSRNNAKMRLRRARRALRRDLASQGVGAIEAVGPEARSPGPGVLSGGPRETAS
jgi:RNA polymerase sigma factor (sigma-70 family)